MNNKKATKRALLTSVTALVMCVVMLAGTTFAWFTDTATANVNKIQAGTLDVALEMATQWGSDGKPTEWKSAEGQTLEFRKANGATDAEKTNVLWEPGCTYTLPELRISNNGNLALKYKIVINGIQGSAKLNTVIAWTMTMDDNTTALNTEHHLNAKTVSAGETTYDADIFTISGHMDENAGNTYQGESIDGISITVYATQDTVEFDSINDQYDASAMYPLMPQVDVEATQSAAVDATSALTSEVKMNGSTIPAGTVLYTTHEKDKSEESVKMVAASSNGSLKETIKTTATSTDAMTISIDYKYVTTDGDTSSETPVKGFSKPITHTLSLSKGLKSVTVKHGTAEMTKAENAAAFNDEKFEGYYYDSTTGTLYIKSSTYSDFKVEIEHGFVASVNGQGYDTFAEAVTNATDGSTIQLLGDATVDSTKYNDNSRLYVDANNVTIDLNNYTLTVPNYTLILKGDGIKITNGNMIATTTTAGQTNGSYAVIAKGKNIVVDNVKMTGGISATGANSDSTTPDASVTITNCEITATNFYTVCAQRNAKATIENTKLVGGAGTFFWVEAKGYKEGNESPASVNSKIIYDNQTVEFSGSNKLYNEVGKEIIVKNLTVKDENGDNKLIDAVAVQTESHLAAAVEAGQNVILASDITLTKMITINKSLTLDLNGHTLNYTGTAQDTRVKTHRAIWVDGENVNVTVQNGSITTEITDTTYEGEYDAIVVGHKTDASDNANVTLETMTITMNSKTGACLYVFKGNTGCVKSGTYTNSSTATGAANEKAMLVNQSDNATQAIFVSGGTFHGADPAGGDNSKNPTSFLAADCKSTQNTDGSYTVTAK